MADRVGQQLGNYRLFRLIGQGSFADVYLGEHIHLETQVAVKVLHTRLADTDVEQFRSEARTIAQLVHPHIVRVFDFGVDAMIPFLVMDFAAKGTLRNLYPKGTRLPPASIASYVKQIALALQYAHERRLIHCDIKPENLLVRQDEELLISDFGLATFAQSSRDQSTHGMAGTVAYMAPEQIQGHPRPASDQYALGIIVYEWLSGERPFAGSLVEIIAMHVAVPPPSLCEKIPILAPAVEQVVMTALAKDPKHRFTDVQTFALTFEQAVRTFHPTPPSVVRAYSSALSPAFTVSSPTQSPSSATVLSPSFPPTQLTEEKTGSYVSPQAPGGAPSARENPFTYGNPISDPARFIGRRPEVAQVFSRLRNIEFESSSFVGERRVGKTSLLNYLAHPTVRRSHGLDPDKSIFVYVDLQMVNRDTTPTRLWQHFLRQMAQYCQKTDIKQMIEQMAEKELIDTFALADVFDCVDENDQYVVLLLDEFEKVTENPNFGPDFFYGLRSLAIHHHLSLVTSSRHGLIELCHSEAIRSSPFFNIFANIHLGLFTETDARQLISTSLAKTNVAFAEAEIDTILRIAGCHPYFLQSACYFLFEAYSKNMNSGERTAFLCKAFREEATAHLSDYWRTSNDQEKIVLLVLSLLEQQRKSDERAFHSKQLHELYSRSDQVLGRLEKRSLLTSKGDTWRVFNAAFSEWICTEITTAVHDQQGYNEWLKANNDALTRLSTRAKRDLRKLLPKISDQYRKLIASWASDSRNLATVRELLGTALGDN